MALFFIQRLCWLHLQPLERRLLLLSCHPRIKLWVHLKFHKLDRFVKYELCFFATVLVPVWPLEIMPWGILNIAWPVFIMFFKNQVKAAKIFFFLLQACSLNLFSAETGRRLLDTTLIFNLDPNGGKPEKVSENRLKPNFFLVILQHVVTVTSNFYQ